MKVAQNVFKTSLLLFACVSVAFSRLTCFSSLSFIKCAGEKRGDGMNACCSSRFHASLHLSFRHFVFLNDVALFHRPSQGICVVFGFYGSWIL